MRRDALQLARKRMGADDSEERIGVGDVSIGGITLFCRHCQEPVREDSALLNQAFADARAGRISQTEKMAAVMCANFASHSACEERVKREALEAASKRWQLSKLSEWPRGIVQWGAK